MTEPTSSHWQRSAARAADNLLRILREIELDVDVPFDRVGAESGGTEADSSEEDTGTSEKPTQKTPKTATGVKQDTEVKENSSGDANGATASGRQKNDTSCERPLSPSRSKPKKVASSKRPPNANSPRQTSPAASANWSERRMSDEIGTAVDLHELKDAIRTSRANAEARAGRLKDELTAAEAESRRSKQSRTAAGHGQKQPTREGKATESTGERSKPRKTTKARSDAATKGKHDIPVQKPTKVLSKKASSKVKAPTSNGTKKKDAGVVSRDATEKKGKAREEDKAKEAEAQRRRECERMVEERLREQREQADAAEQVMAEKKREAERIAEEQRRVKEQIDLVDTVLTAHQNRNAYQVLGLQPEASDADIKRAYRKLCVRIHPDKNTAAKAAEAFHAVTSAYEVLKCPAKRAEYEQKKGVSPAAATSPRKTQPESNVSFDVMPNGTGITVQSEDARFAHLNGSKASIMGYDPGSDLYTVKLDKHDAHVLSKASALFQNAIVCLRAHMAHELGVFLVTLASYWKEGKTYYARYGGGTKMATLKPEQFIIPTGTVVRLDGLETRVDLNGRYGTVVDWKERLEWGADTSYYIVTLSSLSSVQVAMANVCL
ncbi:hypothetical protein ACHAXT_009101 [Thalassiosira profunda]